MDRCNTYLFLLAIDMKNVLRLNIIFQQLDYALAKGCHFLSYTFANSMHLRLANYLQKNRDSKWYERSSIEKIIRDFYWNVYDCFVRFSRTGESCQVFFSEQSSHNVRFCLHDEYVHCLSHSVHTAVAFECVAYQH